MQACSDMLGHWAWVKIYKSLRPSQTVQVGEKYSQHFTRVIRIEWLILKAGILFFSTNVTMLFLLRKTDFIKNKKD